MTTKSVCAFLFLGLMVSCSGINENSSSREWVVPDEAASTVNPVRYDVDSVMAGKKIFTEHCLQCHGYYAEGDGVVGARLGQQPANLLRLAGKQAEGAFAWKIRQGRGEMPAFDELLTEQQVWMLVNFIASLENEEGSQGYHHE